MGGLFLKKYRFIVSGLLLIFSIVVFGTSRVSASDFMNQTEPHYGISYSPDGGAFTTDAGVTRTEFYERGEKVYVSDTAGLPSLQRGEHYFSYERGGNIPIYFWEVVHPYGKCIHDDYPAETQFHGVSFGKRKCGNNYFSGWNGYCRDCKGKVVDFMIYMGKETARAVKGVNLDLDYYYLCPSCSNLEQARGFGSHTCKAISLNRYFVVYDANGGTGYMQEGLFTYNNADTYEFQPIEHSLRLAKNRFIKEGYYFCGWNTEADGTGISYGQEAEVKNLSEQNNGRVTLYAQWRIGKNQVLLQTGEGSYKGESDPVREGTFQSNITFLKEEIRPPKGASVHFNSQGGDGMAKMQSSFVCVDIVEKGTIEGKWKYPTYTFSGKEENVDCLEAVYKNQGVVLPLPHREGYSFCGWFLDEDGKEFVGNAGDVFFPVSETTLYAKWADLALISTENRRAYGGSGAVDLSWKQEDPKEKNYRIYQKKENGDFLQISATSEQQPGKNIEKEFLYNGQLRSFSVPETGKYTILLQGAAGEGIDGNWGGSYSKKIGGKGGEVSAVFMLQKGDRLTILTGGLSKQGNAPGQGGKGIYFGSGGGYSMVTSQKMGVLLIAGGGGGAGFYENGKDGGKQLETPGMQAGQEGSSGGGGGATGGNAGDGEVHFHQNNCRHVHVGNPREKGGCYRQAHICNNSVFLTKVIKEGMYYGNVDNDGNPVFCVRCHSYECIGHPYTICNYRCVNCNEEYSVMPQKCEKVIGYELTCGMEEGIICGYEDRQVLTSVPGHGGTSYVNQQKCLSYDFTPGVNDGLGYCRIEGTSLDIFKGNNLKDVKAADEAAPGRIEHIEINLMWEKQMQLTVTAPDDAGTLYQHKVISYDPQTDEKMCESNITIDRIVSGVCGFRYRIDDRKSGNISEKDLYFDKVGENTTTLLSKAQGKYLHIAAQDVAGNLGEVSHREIQWGEMGETLIKTTPIVIEEGENVYYADEKGYFVRADDISTFDLSFSGFVVGDRVSNYQVHLLRLCQNVEAEEADIEIRVDPQRQSGGAFRYPENEIEVQFPTESLLRDGRGIVAQSENQGQILHLKISFLFPKKADGESIFVVPGALADGMSVLPSGERKISSLRQEDYANGVRLTGDGTAPQMIGIEQLEAPDVEHIKGSREICLEACDEGSGLKEFYVEITNRDRDMYRKISADHMGRIVFTVDEKDPLYEGRFSVLCYAIDHVGNINTWETAGLGISVSAYLERLLAPHAPVFRRGESGRITVVTTGYVERVVIAFPEEFTSQDPSLYREIVFLPPLAYTENRMEFMVPEGVEDGIYEILVTAYRTDSDIDRRPEKLQLQVKGSVADLIRTRLR